MRWLVRLISLAGLAAGLNRIGVLWYPEAGGTDVAPNDCYTEISMRYGIPIALSPEYERALP